MTFDERRSMTPEQHREMQVCLWYRGQSTPKTTRFRRLAAKVRARSVRETLTGWPALSPRRLGRV